MKYNPTKFPYAKLKKETQNGSRKYITPEGIAVPSVTTVLDATKSAQQKAILHEWRKRVGPKKAIQISTEASSRGTRMHKFLEDYVKSGNLNSPGTNPFSIQSHRMAQTIITEGLPNCDEVWGTEISLYFPEVYAGTTDMVGIHSGKQAIMDHKQTNKLKKREWIDDYFIQLTAYANAHNEVYDTKIKKGVIFMCSADNVYQEFIVEGKEFKKYSDMWFKRLEEYYEKFM